MKERKHHHHHSSGSVSHKKHSTSSSSSSNSSKHSKPSQNNNNNNNTPAPHTTSIHTASPTPTPGTISIQKQGNDASSDMFRAKLFSLNQITNKWIDIGIGHPKIYSPRNKKGTYFVQFFLEGDKSEVYSENLANELIIENPKDKQITISNDSTEEDIAISFQNDEGRLSLWQQIHIAQQNIVKEEDGSEMQLEGMEEGDNNNPKKSTINPNLILPLPTFQNINQFSDILNNIPFENRSKLVSELRTRQKKMFRGFSEVFRECGANKFDCQELNVLVSIFVTFVFMKDKELLQVMLSDDNYMLTMGILEYEEGMRSSHHIQRHRDFFSKQVKQLQENQFRDKAKLDEAHFNFRLQYLRDSVLAHILDDHTIYFLNAVSSQLDKSLVSYILTSKEAMTSISNALSERDYSALAAVFEMFFTAKSPMDSIFEIHNEDIYEVFEDYLIFDILESFLRFTVKASQHQQQSSSASAISGGRTKKHGGLDEKQLQNVPMLIARIMTIFMNNKPTCFFRYLTSNEQKFQSYTFFSLLCESMIASKHPINNQYFSELVRLILMHASKETQHSVLIEQFVIQQLPKMSKIFTSNEFSEEVCAIRNEFLEIIASIYNNCADVESLLTEQARKTLFSSIPMEIFSIFKSNQKCLCASVLRIFTLLVTMNHSEVPLTLYSEGFSTIIQYYTKKIRKSRNLVYSELILLFQAAEQTQRLQSVLAEIGVQFTGNKLYTQIQEDLRLQSEYIKRKQSDPMSLFDFESIKIKLSSSNQYSSTILGAEDIDSIGIAATTGSSSQSQSIGTGHASPQLRSSKFSSS